MNKNLNFSQNKKVLKFMRLNPKLFKLVEDITRGREEHLEIKDK